MNKHIRNQRSRPLASQRLGSMAPKLHVIILGEFLYDTLVRELVQHSPVVSQRIVLNKHDANALLQQFCREDLSGIGKKNLAFFNADVSDVTSVRFPAI